MIGLKKGLSPKKLNDIIKYDGFQEKCREIISRLENRDLCKRINISLQNKALNLSDLNKMGLACRKGKGGWSNVVYESISFSRGSHGDES